VTPESRTKAEIRAYLKKVPGLWYCHVAGSGFGRAGVPDYLLCWHGRFIALEVKGPGGQPSPWQVREIEAINKCGGDALVVRSVNDVDAALRKIAHQNNFFGGV
jgi:hypothetical protein